MYTGISLENPHLPGVLILAGGSSRRMGYPKPFLPWSPQINFAEHIISVYRDFGCEQIFLALNRDLDSDQWQAAIQRLREKVNIIWITKSENGRFSSFRQGLCNIPLQGPVFIHNVDSPFISQDLLFPMYLHPSSSGYVVPVFKQKSGHPILIHNNVVSKIRSLSPNNQGLILRDFLRQFQRYEAQVNSADIHLDINTPNQYRAIFEKMPECQRTNIIQVYGS